VTELELPKVERPTASIVMVTRNRLDWLRQAIAACLEQTEPCYELIVVDDGSTDGTREFVAEEVSGITILPHDRNIGYGLGCNLGASRAIGRYLVFLNSDTLVHAGWLPPLLARFEQDESVGAAGPRILNFDGSLQLAGALLTRAGATVPYGDHDDPERPEYTFTRDVDYGSGACLAVRRSAFERVGGFDPAYGLVYFEDTDFCLRLWEIGLRTIYEPRSTVTHVGGGGSEPDPATMLLALRNRSIFERRWRSLLARYPLAPPSSRRRLLAARDVRASARVLVIDDAACAERFAEAFPTARITLVGADAARATVELAEDPASVLRERRLHFDAVVAAAPTFDRLGELIAETQPQATLLQPDDAQTRTWLG
jgi:O-antigen biosynthesis protein